MKLFELFGEIKIKDGKAISNLDDIDDKASSISKKLGGAAKKAAKFGTKMAVGAGVVGGAMLGIAKKTSGALDRVDKLSQKMGMSAETFQEWDFIASQSGASMESLKMGAKTLNMRMGDLAEGTGAGADAFAKLGMTYEDVKEMSPEQQFEATIKKLQSMENVTERNAIASDLFGRAGQELIPLLNSEGETIDELKEKAHELGMVQSDEAVKAGAKFSDSLDQTTRMLKGMGTQIAVKLLPIVNTFLEWIRTNMPLIREKFSQAMNVIIPLVNNMYNQFKENVLPILKDLFSWTKENMPIFKKVFSSIFKAVGEVIKTVWKIVDTLLLPVLKVLFDWVGKYMPIFADIISDVFEGVQSVIETTIGVVNSIIDAFKSAYNWAKKLIKKSNEVSKQREEKSEGGGFYNVKGMRADGGPVTAGESYIVGERGPELFTPNKNGNITSNEDLGGGGVSVDTMIVRKESDINKIARQLHNLQLESNRGLAL